LRFATGGKPLLKPQQRFFDVPLKEELIEAFRTAMKEFGLDCTDPIVADGELHRFAAGNDANPNSWYVLHLDPPVNGRYGCWKRGIEETWRDDSVSLSDAELRHVEQCWKQAAEKRDQELKKRREEARQEAGRIWSESTPLNGHWYLQMKGVKAHGELREHQGRIVVPLQDVSGVIHTVQYISADGTKRFMKGGHVTGHFFTLADEGYGPLVISEGYGTAASIYEATGFSAVAAMNSGNLLPVAKALREKWPGREIILAADNDQFAGEGKNPGLEKGCEAAFAIGGKLAAPQFFDLSMKPTDFNDLMRLAGPAEVKRQIESAVFCGATNGPPPPPPPPNGPPPTGTAFGASGPRIKERPPFVPLPYRPPPLDLFPPAMQDYILAAAQSMRIDRSRIILPLLSSLAAAIGNTRIVQLKTDYTEIMNLWTAVLGRSGHVKSPAIKEATSAILAKEKKFARENREAKLSYEREYKQWKAAPKGQRGDPPAKPTPHTILMDDLTLAVLVTALYQNNRLIVAKDELSHWYHSFDQFHNSKGADVSRWLSLHTGNVFCFDRKMDQESYRIFNPSLSITGGIQPKILKMCLTTEYFERGLPARFLFAYPPEERRVWTEATVPGKIRLAVVEIFDRLFALDPALDQFGDPTPDIITPDGDAKAAFVDFYNEIGIEAMNADDKEEAAWNKLAGHAARLAGVGQLARNGANKINGDKILGDTTVAAIELARWFGNEAIRIYQLLSDDADTTADRRLVQYIADHGGIVTVRDIITNYRPLKNQTEAVERKLGQFVKDQIGEWLSQSTTSKGGQPSRRFKLFSGVNLDGCLQNPKNAAENSSTEDADSN